MIMLLPLIVGSVFAGGIGPAHYQQNASFYTLAGNSSNLFAVFYLKYDQEIYVKEGSDIESLEEFQGDLESCKSGRSVRASRELQGLFDINCTGSGIAKTFIGKKLNTPVCSYVPEVPIPGQSVMDAGGSFINLIQGGLAVDSKIINSMVTFILPLNSSKEMFSSGSAVCNFTRNKNSAISLVNVDGIDLELASQVKFKSACTSIGTKGLVDTLDQLNKMVEKPKEITALHLFNELKYFSWRETYAACTKATSEFLAFSERTTQVFDSKMCTKQRGDLGYDEDPCCSEAAALTKCCGARSVDLTVNVLSKGIDDSTKCKNQKKITALLSETLEALQGSMEIQSQPTDEEKIEPNNYVKLCENLIKNSTCSRNSDCRYSNLCTGSKKCAYKPENWNVNLLLCSKEFMNREVRNQFENDLVAQNITSLPSEASSEFCNDFEYNNDNSGLCTFLPKNQLFQCGFYKNTQTGICFNDQDQSSCEYNWIPKAKTAEECISKGHYCRHTNRKLSLLSERECTACGGDSKYRYEFSNEKALGNNGIGIGYGAVNGIPTPDVVPVPKLSIINIIETIVSSTASQLVRETIPLYQQYLVTFINLFKSFACDCIEKSDSCFDEVIRTQVQECLVEPDKNSECGDVSYNSEPAQPLTTGPAAKSKGKGKGKRGRKSEGRQQKHTPSMKVYRFSAANIIANFTIPLSKLPKLQTRIVANASTGNPTLSTDSTKPTKHKKDDKIKKQIVHNKEKDIFKQQTKPVAQSQNQLKQKNGNGHQQKANGLHKRCNALPDYEIVMGTGGIIGQIIGNGVMIEVSTGTWRPARLCLRIDPSIPTNILKYPKYGIGMLLGNTVYKLDGVITTFNGVQVCAVVADFPGMVYIPILFA